MKIHAMNTIATLSFGIDYFQSLTDAESKKCLSALELFLGVLIPKLGGGVEEYIGEYFVLGDLSNPEYACQMLSAAGNTRKVFVAAIEHQILFSHRPFTLRQNLDISHWRALAEEVPEQRIGVGATKKFLAGHMDAWTHWEELTPTITTAAQLAHELLDKSEFTSDEKYSFCAGLKEVIPARFNVLAVIK